MLQLLESRVWLEAGASLALMPLWRLAPRGDGHTVMVLPGLGAGDESTAILRGFLRSRGYIARRWGQGRNLGFRHGVFHQLRDRVLQLAAERGRTVSLVGWSLGGIFARELAKEVPNAVRQVISLASPFTGHPRATNAFRLYELVSGHRLGAPEIHEPLRAPPPVPTTSIWSRTDGVVSWRCSVERESPLSENIEINASHLGIGAHPLTLYVIADRLAQPEGHWQPFRREGWRALVYGDARTSRRAPARGERP
ncbi:MAG TPA: alpha/beta hydrolase [Kofleriaceae bacterium]|nr:alpha/beta hydrolase [Kofleriaceae bacterium]